MTIIVDYSINSNTLNYTGAKDYVYLNPGDNWKSDNARFSAYFFGGSRDVWMSMFADNSGTYYYCEIPHDSSGNDYATLFSVE